MEDIKGFLKHIYLSSLTVNQRRNKVAYNNRIVPIGKTNPTPEFQRSTHH